jgi:hypothetical protein
VAWDLKGLSRLADQHSVARPENPKVKEAIVAALAAACSHGHVLPSEEGARLSDAWDNALFTAFDAARPPGKFESWARKSLPKLAAGFHVAKLEMTSPDRCDVIRLWAVAIFESRRRELQAQEG